MDYGALVARIPAWGRVIDEPGYRALIDAVRAELQRRGGPFALHDDHVRFEVSGSPLELSLLPLAETCAGQPREQWPAAVAAEVQRRVEVEQLGRELDAVRGDFERAKPRIKLRVSRAEELGQNVVSAPIAGNLKAVLVLDLPSFVTTVRPADLASWERPAEQLVRLALENVKSQERVEVNRMEIAGLPLFAVSGQSFFVATLGLAADDLLGPESPFGALVAMPSRHILLCHALTDQRSLSVLQAMAAGTLQAFQAGPGALAPDLFWKRGDRFVALPVRQEGEKIVCDVPAEFDEQVASRLP